MMFSGVRVRMVMSGLALTAPPQNEQSYGQPRAPTMFASILPSAALHRFHDTPNRLASMTCAPFAKLGRCRKKGRSSAWLPLCDPGPARACESREARHLPATRPPKTSYLTVTDSVASGCSVLLHVKVPVVENMTDFVSFSAIFVVPTPASGLHAIEWSSSVLFSMPRALPLLSCTLVGENEYASGGPTFSAMLTVLAAVSLASLVLLLLPHPAIGRSATVRTHAAADGRLSRRRVGRMGILLFGLVTGVWRTIVCGAGRAARRGGTAGRPEH